MKFLVSWKDETTEFDTAIANNKSFEYKTKFLESTVAQFAPNQASEILKNAGKCH